jgi:3-methyladenine DNA glycosylase AlkD
MARPPAAFDASRYFRGDTALGFLNVGAARIRSMAKGLYRAHRHVWSVDAALAFADALIVDRHLEVKGLGIELMACYRRSFEPRLLAEWKRWLTGGYSDNWATTDALCGSLIGPLLVRRPRLVREVTGWARDPNMWVRRASVVSLIPLLRTGAAVGLAYDVARRLHADEEDLIRKATPSNAFRRGSDGRRCSKRGDSRYSLVLNRQGYPTRD